MDNKEFAKLLLCEATELLEGAQAEAYKARKEEEKHNQETKDIDRIKNRLTRKKEDIGNSAHKTKFNKFLNNYLTKYESKLDSLPIDTIKDEVNYYNAELSAFKRGEKEAKKDGFDYRKQSKKRGHLSECADIAVLLTEAALLLNDED